MRRAGIVVGLVVVAAAVSGGSCFQTKLTECTLSCGSDGECEALGTGFTCSNSLCASPEQATCVPDTGGSGSAVTAVSAGAGYACALDAGSALVCWGLNAHHVVTGDGNANATIATPVGRGGTWTQISAGATHACGVQTDHTGYCWGDDTFGMSGGAGAGLDLGTPTPIMPPTPAKTWDKLVAGGTHTCGIAAGELFCFGDNTDGELGTTTMTSATPMQVLAPSLGTSNVVIWGDVWAGPGVTCARADSTAGASATYCWGATTNGLGRIGDGASAGSATPTAVSLPNGDTKAVEVAIGREAVCAVTSQRNLYCWGFNGHGATGFSVQSTAGDGTPHQIVPPGDWTEVASGGGHACAIGRGGQLTCWGTALSGGLGTGVWTQVNVLPVAAPAVGSAAGIAIGDDVLGSDGVAVPEDLGCVALDGVLTCWGANDVGQLGTTQPGRVATPLALPASADSADVELGLDHVCVASPQGDIKCWGSTEFGQANGGGVARGSAAAPCSEGAPCDLDAVTPTGFNYGSDLAGKLAGGYNHTCIQTSDSMTVTCWGDNELDQLGKSGPVGSAVDASSGSNTFSIGQTDTLLASANQTCAVAAPLTHPLCWGNIVEVGPTPSPQSSGSSDSEMTYDDAVKLAFNLTSGGILQGSSGVHWTGDNGVGQFGEGNIMQLGSGVFMIPSSGGNPLADLAMGEQAFACGITTDNAAKCWGSNALGVFDDNQPSPSPVAMLTGAGQIPLTGCTSIAAGNAHACAICDGKTQTLYCWGDNTEGQVGDGSSFGQTGVLPVAIPPIGSAAGWAFVKAGHNFTCGVLLDGTVACWGDGLHGQLANGGGGAPYPGKRHPQLPKQSKP